MPALLDLFISCFLQKLNFIFTLSGTAKTGRARLVPMHVFSEEVSLLWRPRLHDHRSLLSRHRAVITIKQHIDNYIVHGLWR